ncbi:MAG: hypothetical protein AB9844_11150 [Clostridiaceae bacterium]
MKFNSLKKYKFNKIMLLSGFVLSVIWVMVVNAQPYTDFEYYYRTAGEVAKGLQWGDTYTAVGYPIILGFIFKIFGISLWTAKLFNLILLTVNNVLLLEILDRTNIKDPGKKIIFAIFVLFPNNLFYSNILANEVIFTTFLFAITLIYFSNLSNKYILMGLLTAVATMIKPFFIVFFFAVFLVDLIKDKKLLPALKNSALVLLFCALALSPWIYRNTKLFGEFTYVSNNAGIVLYINNNSQNKEGKWMSAYDVENSIANTNDFIEANATQKNNMLNDAAKEWIKSHPDEFFLLGLKRLDNTFFKTEDIYYSTNGSFITEAQTYSLFDEFTRYRNLIFKPALFYIFIYSLIILKNIFQRKTQRLDRFNLYTTVVFYMFTVIYFVTEGQSRYAFPMIFIFIYYFYIFMAFTLSKASELKYKFIRTVK